MKTIDEIETLVKDVDALDAASFSELRTSILERYDELDALDTADAVSEQVRLGAASSELMATDSGKKLAAGMRVAALGTVTASGSGSGTVARMATRKPVPSPEATSTGGPVLLATGMGGITAGTQITDRYMLAEVMADTLNHMAKDGAPRGAVPIARAEWHLPPERQIGKDAFEDLRRMEAVCGPFAQAYDRRTGEALGPLTASGGICQPVNVDYSIMTVATPQRPIRDGLPAFEATRGGIRRVQPPDIAEWKAATGIWTEATDAEPGSATKPVKVMVCGEEVVVYVEAVSTRIGFGNMQSRFAPEQVTANTDVAFAAAAREAEENLLNLIEGICAKKLETAQHLGIGRDLLAAVDYARAAYRNIHRTAEKQSFTAIFPTWVKDLIRTDIAREQAHDNASDFNVWQVTDEQIEDFFTVRNITPIWHLDGQEEPTNKAYKTQYWGTPAEGKKLDELLPNEVLPWYFFPTGAVAFLDGGRLDLGVVRDSTLDATNDYETFIESFEAIDNRIFAKGVWQILSSVKATGASVLPVTPVAP
jgi:hypothetical protein